MANLTKAIECRDGRVQFRIPDHWIEIVESGGGRAFYEDRRGSGTLRVDLLVADAPQPVDESEAFALLTEFPGSNAA